MAYADDFVILSRGHATEALAWARRVMTQLGLALNETKTSIRDARRERFDFLGYSFGPHRLQAGSPIYGSSVQGVPFVVPFAGRRRYAV